MAFSTILVISSYGFVSASAGACCEQVKVDWKCAPWIGPDLDSPSSRMAIALSREYQFGPWYNKLAIGSSRGAPASM